MRAWANRRESVNVKCVSRRWLCSLAFVADTLADTLNRTRQSKGWSARELARRAGVSVTAVTSAEQGKHEPSLPVLRSLPRALEVDVVWLTFGERDQLQRDSK